MLKKQSRESIIEIQNTFNKYKVKSLTMWLY